MATRKRTRTIDATLDTEPTLDDVEREAMAIEATPPPKANTPAPGLPLWAWGAIAFGAYKLLGKPGRR